MLKIGQQIKNNTAASLFGGTLKLENYYNCISNIAYNFSQTMVGSQLISYLV